MRSVAVAVGVATAVLLGSGAAGGPARGLSLSVISRALAADAPSHENLDAVKRRIAHEKAHGEALARKAASLRREAEAARQERIHTARIIQDDEAQVSNLADTLMTLARREAQEIDRLGDKRMQAGQVMMALQRLARNPPEAMLAQPMGPNDMVRGAILLRAAVPAIEARVADLKAELDDLAHTRAEISRRRTEKAQALASLEKERRRLDLLFAEKKHAIAGVEGARARAEKRIAALARKAKSLRDLLARIDKDRLEQLRIKREKAARSPNLVAPRAAPRPSGPDTLAPSLPFSQARGQLPFPVVGRIVQRFGEKTNAGFDRKGLTIQTLPGAQVVAPYDGRVVYADKFRGYGLLLILDHGEGYHSLLAGMARIDGVLGQRVLAGEPVGVMGRPKGAKPELYVELRHDGQPINPTPWLAARKGKVEG